MKYYILFFLSNLLLMNCNAQIQNDYQLKELNDVGDSCFGYKIESNGKLVTLSKEVSEALKCVNVIGLHQNFLYYAMDNQIKQHNLNTKESKTLFSLYPDIDGVDGPFWSPDYSKIAFTIVNQEMNHGYQHQVRILVFDINPKGQTSNKRKYDVAAYFDCGSRCGSEIEFIDQHTIRYRDIMDRGGDVDIINYKTLNIE